MDFGTLWRLAILWAVPLALLLAAWRAGLRADPQSVSTQRRRASAVGLGLLSASIAAGIAFDVQTSLMSGGWLPHISAFYMWVRIGFCAAAAGLLLSIFGRGRSRLWAILSGLALVGVWLMWGWTSP